MLTEEDRALLTGKNFASFSTLMPDGSPQTTVVWVDTDGEHVLVNTAVGRVKERNVARDARVALTLFEQEDPYNQLAIRGRVVETTLTGAEDSIDDLARRYLGTESYPWRSEGERRVLLKILPERVIR